MNILFVHASAEWSTYDTAMGYRNALVALGHDVRDFTFYNRLKYHAKALGAPLNQDMSLVSRLASESVLPEALLHGADLVVIACAMAFHPNALWLLRRASLPVALILTESPYDDADEVAFVDVYPEMTVATCERTTAAEYHWLYLRAAHDPQVHRPCDPSPDDPCDVLLIGTGWKERQDLLEAIDWTGITLHLRGLWPHMSPSSPLHSFYLEGCVDNVDTPALYRAAKVCLNLHRAHPTAESVNPRAIELAACGAFQVSDRRAELVGLFGESVPTFASPEELGYLIRYYLDRPTERDRLAQEARRRVQGETFLVRATQLLAMVDQRTRRRTAGPVLVRPLVAVAG